MMKTSLSINNRIINLNDFTQNYIGNILYGIARVFETLPETIMVCISPEEFRFYTDRGEIDISKKDFARQLIESTIKGALSPLKGILWMQNIIITSNTFDAYHERIRNDKTAGFTNHIPATSEV